MHETAVSIDLQSTRLLPVPYMELTEPISHENDYNNQQPITRNVNNCQTTITIKQFNFMLCDYIASYVYVCMYEIVTCTA